MSSCDNSNIKQNYIVANTNEFDTLTACTGIWTSNIYGCSPINVNDLINLKVVKFLFLANPLLSKEIGPLRYSIPSYPN